MRRLLYIPFRSLQTVFLDTRPPGSQSAGLLFVLLRVYIAPSAAAAEDNGENVPGNTEGSGDQCGRTNGVKKRSNSSNGDEKDDGIRSNRGGNQPRSFVYPGVPSPVETGEPPTIQDGEKAGEETRHLTKGPPPAVVRVGVWDTATATLTSNISPVSSSLSNQFINLSGYDGNTFVNSTASQEQRQPQPQRKTSSSSQPVDGEVLSSGDPGTPFKYEGLLEKSEKSVLPVAAGAAAAIGGDVASTRSSSCYPKLVDRNAFSGGYPDGDAGGNGLREEDATGGDMAKTSAPPSGTPRTDGLVDASLASAAEHSLSMEDNGQHRLGKGDGK